MIDNMIVRLYLFFNVHKFQMGISESVCNDAYTKKSKSKAQNDIKVLITTEYIFFVNYAFNNMHTHVCFVNCGDIP